MLVVSFITDCKKYPDGPCISFRSPYERLTTAVWALEYWEVNGIDSTAAFLAKPCLNSSAVGNKFYFNAKKGTSSFQGGCSIYGNFSFDKPYNDIDIKIYSYSIPIFGPAPFPSSGSIDWKIRKLTHTALWIETNYSSIDYKINFKRIGDNV
ncbi:MAG: hypothetical protein HY063_09980 [Bacteroidetes bacterium]|nr:hypothetical protein [Bacteroidota bacterium]